MKKLKANKLFQPCAVDVDDELYPNGIFVFNITKLLNFIVANKNKFPIEYVNVNSIAKYSFPKVNEDTVKTANLALPIILAEISPNNFNVIDGRHRLEKAFRGGHQTIPAYRVIAEQHIPFLTTQMGYQEYIKYWNEKVKNYQKEFRQSDYMKSSISSLKSLASL